MAGYVKDLPDEILLHIFSLLTLRDSVRARLSASRWKYLPDYRTVLNFDALNVLGKSRVESRFSFVKAVDEFLNVWRGQKISMLKVNFILGNEYASHIDRWIATAIRMGVEEFDLNFDEKFPCQDICPDKYVFPIQLLHPSCLRRLCLRYCMLKLSSTCTSWLRQLTTLHLRLVPLNQSDLDYILSGCLNLTSLELIHCNLSFAVLIYGQLKKLVIKDGKMDEIKLNCPNLEIFEHYVRAEILFDHVPMLRNVSLFVPCRVEGCALIFDDLTRKAPLLETLTLSIFNEVQSVPATTSLGSCLKHLHLLLVLPRHFDLFNVTYFVNASPALETLYVRFGFKERVYNPKWECQDRPHFRLKQVKFKGYYHRWKKLALYFLRNAVGLEQMIIDFQDYYPSIKEKVTAKLGQKISPTVKLTIL